MKPKSMLLAASTLASSQSYATLPTNNFIQTECRGVATNADVIISLNTYNHAADIFVPSINIHQAGAYVYVSDKGVFSYDGVTTIFIADKETGLPSALIVGGKAENQVTLTCAPFLPLSKNKPVVW